MRSGKKVFALVLSQIRDVDTSLLTNEMLEALTVHDAQLYVFHLIHDDSSYDVLRLINFDEVDGLFIYTKSISPETKAIDFITARARKSGTPVLSIDGFIEGAMTVSFDYSDAFENLVQHVISEHGCRKLDMMAGFRNNSFSDERIAVYRKVLERNGIPFREERVFYGDFWHDPTVNAMKELLADPAEQPDAIICVNDSSAVAVCEVLHERGIAVPSDIIVTGFDGIVDATLNYPNITTAKQDFCLCAQTAVRMMLDRLDGKDVENQSIPFAEVYSQSCGCEKITDGDRNKAMRILSDELSSSLGFDLYMIQFGNSMLKAKNFEEVEKTICEYSFEASLICLNESFFDFSRDLSYDPEKPFDGRLKVVSHQRMKNEFFYGEYTDEKHPIPIDSQDDQVEYNVYYFNAIRFGDITLGYAALPIFSSAVKFYKYAEKYLATLAQECVQIQMQQHMQFLYYHDPLTGVYNRRGFFSIVGDKMAAFQDGNYYLNIYSLDMNNLKTINDTYGHADGDFAIKSMSEAMKIAVGDANCINARFGGDEFITAIITEGRDDGGAFETRFKAELAAISNSAGKPYEIVSSCGYSSALITSDLMIDDVIRQSDLLMYSDKAMYKRSSNR